ncbi:MAG: hypothetical protein ACP5RP_00400 [Candidatus Micrarchaeia archaeon]
MSKNKRKEEKIITWPLYATLLALMVLYAVFYMYPGISFVISGLAIAIIIIAIVMDFRYSIKSTGYKRTVTEIAIGLGAIVVLWLCLIFFLHTNHPLDVVPSCSMLPKIRPGDLLLISGVQNIKDINAPIINVTNYSYDSWMQNYQRDELECVFYDKSNPTRISQNYVEGYAIGLYSPYYNAIVPNSSQQYNLVKYTCQERKLLLPNNTYTYIAYTSSISIAGKTIYGDNNNTVIVYKTLPQDSFYKEGSRFVVHRVYAIINASGSYYFLTKGDNNPGLDIQYGNYPASFSDIEGKLVYNVPYIGYIKLLLNGELAQTTGCNQTIVH